MSIRSQIAGVAGALTLSLFSIHSAGAQTVPFASGWIGECVTLASGVCTEPTAAGYARQAMTFNLSKGGAFVRGQAFFFPATSVATIQGRALFDAPTGGNLLFDYPVSPTLAISTSTGDREDSGGVVNTLSGAGTLVDPTALSTVLRAGTVIGTNPYGSVYAGVTSSVSRGILSDTPRFDGGYVQPTLVTGFSYQVGNTVSDVDVLGAGTLATGTIVLPQAPSDGMLETIECGVTVTTLTVTPGTGQTIAGTAPTTCGPNATHLLHYHAANTAWSVQF